MIALRPVSPLRTPGSAPGVTTSRFGHGVVTLLALGLLIAASRLRPWLRPSPTARL